MDWCSRLWSLLLVVVVMEECQDKRDCRIHVNAKTFAPDPCPGVSKFLEVAYQCRPTEFRSRITCENDQMILRCSGSERLAIYSAMFGRSMEGNNQECPALSTADEGECQSECALKTVMDVCHGKKRCSLYATEGIFGDPCREETLKYLSVVYTCVPKRIMKENSAEEESFYNSNCETTTVATSTESIAPTQPPIRPTTLFNLSTTGATGFTDSSVTPIIAASGDIDWTAGIIHSWMGAVKFIQENQEKFILYVILSVLIGLVLLLLVIAIRLEMLRRRAEQNAKLDISDPIANSTRATETPALPPPETSLLLEESSDSNNGIEMLSFQQSNSLRRPPAPAASFQPSSSLDRNGQFARGGSPFYNNTFRSDRNYVYA